MKKKIKIVGVGLTFFAVIIVALFYFGVLHINNPSQEDYPVRGVDVSSYQGEVDWKVLSNQGITFAFIKATEGSSFVDPHFSENWENAAKEPVFIGAYHFFSFESSGKTQAEHFIATVGELGGKLPPVVDVEYYDTLSDLTISVGAIREQLHAMLQTLEEHYHRAPILYATKDTYHDVIREEFSAYPLWVRSVYGKPTYVDDWAFWQFSNRHRLDGYRGKEPYIDMNVYNGDRQSFLARFLLA